jgi:PAS domain S-box-containing protein
MSDPTTTPSSDERREHRDPSAAPLRAVAEAVQDAIITSDAQGRITRWLGGAEALFGRTAEEAIGRPVTLIIPEDRRVRYAQTFAQAVAGDPSAGIVGGVPIEIFAMRRDGTVFPAELTLSRGEVDSEPFFVGVVRDISGRRAAAAELAVLQERFRSAFEHAATGMSMTTPTGRFVAANDAFCALVGRDRETLMSMAFSDLTHPEDQEGDLLNVARMLSGEVDNVHVEKRYLRPDGEVVWVEGNASVVRDERRLPLHYLTQVIDITERRRTEQELARSNAELAQLASVAAHDLNEPLRIVDGFLRLLEGRAGETLDEEGRRFVAEALAGAERMRDLIDALLRYARAGGGTIGRDPVDLSRVAREAEGALAATMWERGTTVEIAALPTVPGDAPLLRQILQNLLANAIRHARPEDPQVRVRVREVDGGWELSVADNGPGFPGRLRDSAFDLFARGHNGGTGLGLAICRRAVERHGGRIWIADGDGQGADVRFTLPARA